MNALSEYQQAVLGQLGIIQWRLRDPAVNAQTQSEPVAESPVVSTPLSEIVKNVAQPEDLVTATPAENTVQQMKLDPLFAQDVLLALEQLQPTVSVTLDWQVGEQIQLNENLLITPPLEQLQAQPQLKKQLWNILQQWQK
ncbi:DNA polymerase III subunit psi [Neptunicella sp.]|uniref:DNA polymerase III subunit psi n=1 Tax=Neptunicella sp. TaxID=2125986 RepID=UPI003F6915CE